MAYENKLPEWKAKGIKPPQSKLDEGWKVQDKPPAAWLNWQMNSTYEALHELQQKSAEKTEVAAAEDRAKVHADQKIQSELAKLPSIKEELNSHINSATAHSASSISMNDPDFPNQTTVLGALKNLKSLANSIKSKVAAAIGAPAGGTDTGDQLAQKINDAKALGAKNLNDKSVAANANESVQSLFSKVGNIVEARGNVPNHLVLSGWWFSRDREHNQLGTMPNRSAEDHHMSSTSHTVWHGDRVFLKPPHGFYDGESWVTAPVPHLRPENIRSGTDVLGVVGTMPTGARKAHHKLTLPRTEWETYELIEIPVIDIGFDAQVIVPITGVFSGYYKTLILWSGRTNSWVEYGGNTFNMSVSYRRSKGVVEIDFRTLVSGRYRFTVNTPTLDFYFIE
ncbi:hypothetical protein [Paenibacillus agilis]|uniref:Uncharacterized protein n=1 Tax=Paenibacillus agilis TaxID=3020863 RepID=A0A559IVU5_9BACL|nr:hypothetical protein [Paenibacillus agilis]TVX91772.1 hypothetical protein FPZ44_01070 [Paenibacillus agilis]